MVQSKILSGLRIDGIKEDNYPVRRFVEKNKVLTLCFSASFVICIIYVLMSNHEELCPQLWVWFNLLFQLSVGFIINYIFYITQIYIPQYKHNKEANMCIAVRIDCIVRHMRDIFSQLGLKYTGEYDENNITKEYCTELLRKLNIDDRVSVINVRRMYSTKVEKESYFTVKEWIISRIEFVESEADKIMKYYAPYINYELMKTLERILQSAMHQNMARSFLQSPVGISFDSCNDDVFLEPYYTLMKKLEEMSLQYKE